MNKNTLSKIAMFVVGAAVGSVVTWKLVETKYKQIADEEIESVREIYAKVYGESDEDEDEEADEPVEEEEKKTDMVDDEEEDEEVPEPYVIEWEDYDENGYATETLYYFDDGVLTDSISGTKLDIDETIGKNSVQQLLDSGEDYIYVRNDWLGIDYEVLRDRRNYSEVE